MSARTTPAGSPPQASEEGDMRMERRAVKCCLLDMAPRNSQQLCLPAQDQASTDQGGAFEDPTPIGGVIGS